MRRKGLCITAGAAGALVAALTALLPYGGAWAASPIPAPPAVPATATDKGTDDPRWRYERSDEDTLQYSTPDSKIEPLPFKVQRLDRENREMRAKQEATEERLRQLIIAVNTLTAAMTAAAQQRK